MYIIQQNLTNNNRSYKPLNAVGVVLHSTANEGATDEGHFNYFNDAYRGANAHVFIDWDSITQFVPFDERAWHCGASGNSAYIGVELCEPFGYDETKFNEVWKRAVWTFAYIFLDVLNIFQVNDYTLPSHNDISNRFPNETDHVDPLPYFNKYGKTVEDFRIAVQDTINTMLYERVNKAMFNDETNISEWALDSVKALKELGIIQGDENGNFRPNDSITRQEMAVLLYRILKLLEKV